MKPSFIAIIPARGGSKGIPRKNIHLLAEKPLVAHSILAAKQSQYIQRCIVSTEDEEIKQVSLKWGSEVYERPRSLATDYALSSDVVLDLLQQLAREKALPDYFVLLQPTSPLRTSQHIDECIEQFLKLKCNSAVSITETEHHPYKCLIENDGLLAPLKDYETLELPRQVLPKVFRPNGAIYCVKSSMFIEKRSFFVPQVFFYKMSADLSVDIDTKNDLRIAEQLLCQK